jgi:hypothetical protein
MSGHDRTHEWLFTLSQANFTEHFSGGAVWNHISLLGIVKVFNFLSRYNFINTGDRLADHATISFVFVSLRPQSFSTSQFRVGGSYYVFLKQREIINSANC